MVVGGDGRRACAGWASGQASGYGTERVNVGQFHIVGAYNRKHLLASMSLEGRKDRSTWDLRPLKENPR